MQSFARNGFEQFIANSVLEPAILLVDPEALTAVHSCGWARLCASGKIRNIVDLGEEGLLETNDVLLSDVEPITLMVVIVTSAHGQVKLEFLRRILLNNNKKMRMLVLAATSDVLNSGKNRANGSSERWELVPFCLVPSTNATTHLFSLTTESCFSPSAFSLRIPKKSNVYEVDIDKDLSADYRSKMKRIALSLGSVITEQMNWDISEAVFSIGFGSSLVANTICANFPAPDARMSNLKQKASLFILDRDLDWWTPIRDVELEPMQRLHDQLILADQSGDILPNLILALEKKSISPKQAFALAVRASSLAGNRFDFQPNAVGEFAKQLNVNRDRVVNILKEISQARGNYIRHQKSEKKQEEDGGGGPLEFGESFTATTLRRVFSDDGQIPSFVVRANKFDVTKVALDIFGTVFGGDAAQKKSFRDQVLKTRTNLVIFYLGGASVHDEIQVMNALSASRQQRQVFIGGSKILDLKTIHEDLFSFTTPWSSGSGMKEEEKLMTRKDFTNLFA